jgi:hypothetical protein
MDNPQFISLFESLFKNEADVNDEYIPVFDMNDVIKFIEVKIHEARDSMILRAVAVNRESYIDSKGNDYWLFSILDRTIDEKVWNNLRALTKEDLKYPSDFICLLIMNKKQQVIDRSFPSKRISVDEKIDEFSRAVQNLVVDKDKSIIESKLISISDVERCKDEALIGTRDKMCLRLVGITASKESDANIRRFETMDIILTEDEWTLLRKIFISTNEKVFITPQVPSDLCRIFEINEHKKTMNGEFWVKIEPETFSVYKWLASDLDKKQKSLSGPFVRVLTWTKKA